MKQKTLTDNINDLPKWAQSEIKVLQMRLREAKGELDRINENPESNTILGSDSPMRGEQIKYLKKDQRITFILPNGRISAKVENDYVEIYAIGIGDLYVRPKVSNVVNIHLKS